MRVAYLDCFSGISGDMLLGAFVQAGVSADLLRETLTALKLGATLDIRTVDRSGISAVKVDVLVKGHAAEIAYVTGQALQLGALDVMCTPVFMKKNRPGTLITVLTDREHAPQLEEMLFRETSTLGLRIREERRRCLERRIETVATPWGDVRIKIGLRDGREVQASPEFEDCRQIAEDRKLPVKQVIEEALQVYRQRSSS